MTALPPPPPLGSAAEAAEARARLAVAEEPVEAPSLPEKPSLSADAAALQWQDAAIAPASEDEQPAADGEFEIVDGAVLVDESPVDVEPERVEAEVADGTVDADADERDAASDESVESTPVDEVESAHVDEVEAESELEPAEESGVIEVPDFDELLELFEEPEVDEASDDVDAVEALLDAEPVAAEPVVAAEPEIVEEPETVEEPVVVGEPETVEEPVVVDEPEVVEELEVIEEAEAVEEPEAVESSEPIVVSDIDAFLDPADSGEQFALRLTGITKSFGQTRAVDAIDLEIPSGSFFGLVGPNGAGKTTTLSMIAGLLSPDEGTVEIAGVDLGRDPRAAKAQMGVLPDRLRTFDRLSGRQLLHYYGVLRGLRPSVAAERTADLAQAFELTSALARPVSDYSAGMTKKLLLAGAMIHAPRLLVLDEPFEAVDPVSSDAILDVLTRYVASGGTVILSSHGMDLVERVCDGVAVIVAGKVLARGSVEEVSGDHTLAERFVQLAGSRSDVEGLEWLHTYSD